MNYKEQWLLDIVEWRKFNSVQLAKLWNESGMEKMTADDGIGYNG